MTPSKYITIEVIKLDEILTTARMFKGVDGEEMAIEIKEALIENAVNPFDGKKRTWIEADELLLWETPTEIDYTGKTRLLKKLAELELRVEALESPNHKI